MCWLYIYIFFYLVAFFNTLKMVGWKDLIIFFCFLGGELFILFLFLCVCLQYVLMFITVMVNIKVWLMGKIMIFSYSKGKEPGVCIPRVTAVPYLKFHCEKVSLRNSPECAAAPSCARGIIGHRSQPVTRSWCCHPLLSSNLWHCNCAEIISVSVTNALSLSHAAQHLLFWQLKIIMK